MIKRLELIKNNTGNNTFDFYKEIDKGKEFITQSIMNVSESIDLFIDNDNTFYIENKSGDNDFTFTSTSIDNG